MTSRKRPRADPSHYDADTSFTTALRSPTTDLGTSISSLDCLSPAPLANTDYFLAGGIDTPGAWSYQRDEHLELFEAEQDHRWNRFAQQRQTQHQTQQEPFPVFVGAHDKSQNGRRQQQMVKTTTRTNESQNSNTQSSISGWHLRKVAWAMTGGLAGKIFNFCWNTTFRGFSAGGGQAYTTDGRSALTHTSSRGDDGGGYFSQQQQYNFSDAQSHHTPHIGTPTSTKAKRPGMDRSVTRSSWVLVERLDIPERDNHDEDEHSPVRKKSRASTAGTGIGGINWQYSKDERPQQSAKLNTNINTASFASPRSRSLGSSNATTATTTTMRNYGLSPSHNSSKRQRTSFTPLASPTKRQSSLSQAELQTVTSLHSSPEVEAFKRQKRRENKKQDESLRRLNAQLQDMIREGKQALGSKVEVIDGRDDDNDDFDMDEGCFVDDVHYY